MSGFAVARGFGGAALRRLGVPVRQVEGWSVAVWGDLGVAYASLPGPRGGAFVVAGVGAEGGGRTRLLTSADWAERLVADPPRVDDLDGHWAFARLRGGALEAATDPVGVRALYVAGEGQRLVVTTHEWAAARLLGAGLDLDALGQAVRLVNPVVPAGYVQGVRRVAAGRMARVRPGGSLSDGGAVASVEPQDGARPGEAVRALAQTVRLERASLGLSGGFDSRVLAALLPGEAALHTFGPDDADARIAARVAAALGRPLLRLPPAERPPPPDGAWERMRVYAASVGLLQPATMALRAGDFATLHARGLAVVDGGMGELVRRRYLTRLPRRRLAPEHAARVARHLAACSHDFWSADAARLLDAGAGRAVEQALAGLPDGDPGARLDAFGLATRVRTTACYEQARLDGHVVCLAAYLQPSVLRVALGLPPSERSGRWMRRAVRQHAPALARIPLAKAGVVYPFGLGNTAASLWHRAARAGRLQDPDPAAAALGQVSEPLRAFARQADPALYDRPRLVAAVDAAVSRGEGVRAVDAWLGFALWHEALRG